MTGHRSGLRTLFRNVLSNYAGTVLTVGATLLTTPYIIRRLGVEQYGLWVLTLSVLSYVGLFQFGIGSGVIRVVAAAAGRDDTDELAAVCATGLVSAAVIGGALTLTLTPVAMVALPRLGVTPHLLATARLVLLINAATLLFGSAFGVFNDMLLGLQRFDIQNGIGVTAKIVGIVALIGALAAGYGVVAFALVEFGVSLLVHLTRYLVLTRFLRVPLDLRRFDWRLLRSLTTFSAFLLLWRLGVQLIWFTDSVVISTFVSVAAVGVYAVASKFPELLRLLIAQVQTVFFPYFSHRFGTSDGNGHRTALVGTVVCLGAVVPVAAALSIFIGPLIGLWVGREFADSIAAARLLMLSFVVSLVPSVIGSGLQASGRVRIPALLAIFEGVLNLGLSLVFAQWWGLTGVALGTTIAGAAINILVVVPYACHALGIPLATFLRQAVLPPLLPLPAMALVLPVRTLAYPTTWPLLVAELAIALALYYGTFWLINPADLRATVRHGVMIGLLALRERASKRSVRRGVVLR